LGAAGSVQGLLRLYSNVPDNTYRFDLFGGAAFTENVGWRAPVAMPTVLNALVNVDVTTGQIDYTDPATFLTAAGTDNVKDTHIDWGDGAGQIGYADIVGTFGGGACSGYLKSDGTCDTPSGAAHDAVTLSTDLGNNLLGLSTQQITLDNQTANYIFAGPTTGGAAAPAFRAMVDADIPSAIARDTELHAAVTLGASLSSIFSLTGQELGLTAWPTFNQNTTGTAGGLSGTPNIVVGTISAGGGGFQVDATGNVTYKTMTATKVSGVAGLGSFVEANSTDTSYVGIMGPASISESFSHQYPDAQPAGSFYLWGTPAGTGDPNGNKVSAATVVTPASGMTTFMATPSIANLFSAVTDEGAFAATLLGYADAAAVRAGLDLERSDTGAMTTTGSFSSPITTNPYTLAAGNCYGATLYYGATGEIDLPAGVDGMNLVIYNTGAFTVTIDPNGSEVIVRDGTSQTGGVTMTLSNGAGNYVVLVFDGTQWVTKGYKGTLAAGA